MKKLLFLFTTMTVSSLSNIAFLNNNCRSITETTNFIEGYFNKQSLFKYKLKTVIINDFNGLDVESLLNEIFLNITENDPEYEEFIIYVSENIEQFKITGNDFVIPGENESNDYTLRITAISANPVYSGAVKIKIVLMNKKIINIAEYETLFSTKIKQLSLEAIGYIDNPKNWEKDMLLKLDKKFIENDANMHGFDGKEGHDSLFIHAFDKKWIEIEFGEALHSYFSEKYENVKIKAKPTENSDYVFQPYKVLNIKVNVTVKNSIDISDNAFANYFKDPIVFSIYVNSTYDQWKKEVFDRVDKRLESLESQIDKRNLFTKNIENINFKHTNKNLWDDEYELYDIEVITPSFIQDELLENKILKVPAKVNRIYSDVSQEINYVYGKEISANASSYVEDSDEKHYVVYSIEHKFQNLHDFQKKYKTIKIGLIADYDSDWPIKGSVGKGRAISNILLKI